MKKISQKLLVGIITIILVCLGYSSISVRAESITGYCGAEEDGKNISWTFEDGTLTFTGTGYMENYGSDVYFNNFHPNDDYCVFSSGKILIEDVNSVIIGEGIKNIGDSAFVECTNISNVSLPQSLEEIGYAAFARCTSLTQIDLSNVNKLGYYCFIDCISLSEVLLSDELSIIPMACFQSCENLEKLNIPASVRTIEGQAFDWCYKYNYNLSEGVEEISNGAFEYCKNEEIILPSTIRKLIMSPFSVDRIVLPADLTSLSDTYKFENKDSGERMPTIVYCNNSSQIRFCKNKGNPYIDLTKSTDLSENDITIKINECEFSGSAMKPEVEVSYTNSNNDVIKLKEGFDYEVEYKNNDSLGTGTAIIKGINVWTGSIEETFNIFANIDSCNISLSAERMLYDGTEKKSDVIVKYRNNTLEIDKDYELTYDNYTDEGTASVKITGKGNFRGDITKEYIIYKNELSDIDCTLVKEEILYDGTEKKPEVKVVFNKIELVEGTDYSLLYSDNVEEGEGKAVITGLGSYKGSVTKAFKIYKNEITNRNCSIEYSEILYDGTEKLPKVKVTFNDTELENGKDYVSEYSDNIEEGVATVKIIGQGSFKGTAIELFNIYKNEITDQNCSIEYSEMVYDGNAKTPIVKVVFDNKELVNGTDYSVLYSDNIEEGDASVKITGQGGYKGVVTKKYKIYKNELTDKDCTVEYSETLYDGSDKKPGVSVKHKGKELSRDKDYTVEFIDNKEVGKATVKITGKGSFKGTVSKYFAIYKYDLAKADVNLSFTESLYDSTEKIPEVTVEYDGKILTVDKDYTVEITDNVMPGTATVKISGLYQYNGVIEKTFTISPISIEDAEVVLNESLFSYDGSAKKPTVEVKIGETILVKDTDYTLTYEDNINDGTAYAVITGKGIYKDIVKVSFVILPYNAGMDAVYPEGTMIDGNFVYGITNDENNEVELICPAIKNIKSVKVPASIKDEDGTVYKVTSIGNKAFYKNTKITSIIIGNEVKSIEDYAFYGCKNVTSIKLGKSVEIIGNSTFRKCTKLKSIVLPKSMDALGKNAFYGCSKLKTITINANTVVDVNTNAIKGVSKKCVIKVPKKLVKKYKKEFDKKTGYKKGMKIKKK